MNSKNLFLSVAMLCGVAVASATPASAVPITVTGTPVSGFGSTTQVASLNGDGYLPFFIPLSQAASGTFTVNGVGTTGDVGNSGGSLIMTIGFGSFADILQDAKLVFDFIDFDIGPTNDYFENDQLSGFFESVRFFTSDGYTTQVINHTADSIAGFIEVTSTGNNQQIVISDLSAFLPPAGNTPFVIGLEFTSFSANALLTGLNTVEFVRATLSGTAVPEPATMLLLGSSGLAGAFMRRRKRA